MGGTLAINLVDGLGDQCSVLVEVQDMVDGLQGTSPGHVAFVDAMLCTTPTPRARLSIVQGEQRGYVVP